MAGPFGGGGGGGGLPFGALISLGRVPGISDAMIIEQYSGSLVRTVGDGEVRLYVRLAVDTATSGWRVRHAQGASGTPHHFDGAPLHIPGPADVRLAAISTVNNSIVIGSWEGYLL